MTEQERFDAQFAGNDALFDELHREMAERDWKNMSDEERDWIEGQGFSADGAGGSSSGGGSGGTNAVENIFNRALNVGGNAASQYLSPKEKKRKRDTVIIAPAQSGNSKTLLIIGGVVVAVIALGALLFSVLRGGKTA
jgi:hypothetical protein